MLSKQSHNLQLALKLCESVGSPYSKRASSMLSNGIFGLPSLNPDEYDSAYSFSLDYGIYTYMRKYAGVDTKALEESAVLGFKETESTVQSVNRKLRGPLTQMGVEWCLEDTRRKISKILGPFNALEWVEHCEWGPGATSTLRADRATVDKKILEPSVSVTVEALPFYRWFLENDIHMFASRTGILPDGPYSVLSTEFKVVPCSRLTTVAKKYDERRIIDIQPTANLFLQKGVGAMIRRRLKRHGVDLDDQSRNQWLASVAGRLQLATIDLAKASDTISSELVRRLLPCDWFFALNALRTAYTQYGDERMYLHKFSAMGNGYTFELESLIFHALVRSACDYQGYCSDISGVYGDDIVVSRRSVRGVISLLEIVGFSVNKDKSFTRGRFYESCGEHFFDGVNVTPLYQKEEIKDFPSAVRAANRLFRFSVRVAGGEFRDRHVEPAWRASLDVACLYWEVWQRRRQLSGKRTLLFPEQPHYLEDDTGLIRKHTFSVRNGLVRFRKLIYQPMKIPGEEYALYALSLRRKCVVDSPFLGFVTQRGVLKSVSIGEAKATLMLRGFPSLN